MEQDKQQHETTRAWAKGKSVEAKGKVSGSYFGYPTVGTEGNAPYTPPTDRERMEEEPERWDGLS